MNRTFCKILSHTLFALSFCGMPAIAEDGIDVELTIPDQILLGDPMPVSVRVQNKSDKSITIMEPIIRRFGRDTITFALKRPNDECFSEIEHPDIYVGGLKIMPPQPCEIRRFAIGESVEYRFSLAYDFLNSRHHQLLFDTPGKYFIQISIYEPLCVKDCDTSVPYDSECRTIQSEISSAVVVAPTDVREQLALNALANLPCEYLLYGPFAFRDYCHADAIKDFQKFFREYSGTRLGRRAALPLGIALSQGLIQDDSHAIIETLEKLAHDNDFELRQSALRILSQLKQ